MPSSGASAGDASRDRARAGAAPRGRFALWANLAVIYVIWGSTYFGIAVSIETIPPFLMAAIRFAIAGLLLLAWDLLRHPEARRPPDPPPAAGLADRRRVAAGRRQWLRGLRREDRAVRASPRS